MGDNLKWKITSMVGSSSNLKLKLRGPSQSVEALNKDDIQWKPTGLKWKMTSKK